MNQLFEELLTKTTQIRTILDYNKEVEHFSYTSEWGVWSLLIHTDYEEIHKNFEREIEYIRDSAPGYYSHHDSNSCRLGE